MKLSYTGIQKFQHKPYRWTYL